MICPAMLQLRPNEGRMLPLLVTCSSHSHPPHCSAAVQDLVEANKDRAARPWIIVMGHRPMYCTVAVGGRCDGEHEASRLVLSHMGHAHTTCRLTSCRTSGWGARTQQRPV